MICTRDFCSRSKAERGLRQTGCEERWVGSLNSCLLLTVWIFHFLRQRLLVFASVENFSLLREPTSRY